MLMQNDRKFRDCSALYVTCSKTVMTTTRVLLCFCSRVVVFTSSLFFFCVYYHFVFIEPFPNVSRKVRSLKWPVTIKNFALGL